MARSKPWVPDAAEQASYYDDNDWLDNSASPLSAGLFVRTLRALSGSVAAGLAVLAVVVIVMAVVGDQRGFPGPGAMSITVHVAGTAAALLCQRFTDRRRDFIAVVASLAVFAIAGAVLWTQWWN